WLLTQPGRSGTELEVPQQVRVVVPERVIGCRDVVPTLPSERVERGWVGGGGEPLGWRLTWFVDRAGRVFLTKDREAQLVYRRSDGRGQVVVPIGDVEDDQPGRSERPHLVLDGLRGQEMDGDRVGRERVHDEHVEAPVRLVRERESG